MGVRLSKAWQPLDDEVIAAVPGTLGVFELGDAAGEVVYLGFAGARELFGLRSAIATAAADHPATSFRYEENMQYTSRFDELLMVHIADSGDIPPGNQAARTTDPSGSRRVGRLSPG